MARSDRVKLHGTAGDLIDKAFRFTYDGGRVVFDGAVQNGSASVTSVKAKFTASDVGFPIFGSGIPLGTTIQDVAADGQSATMSAAATSTVTSGGTLIIRALDVSGYMFAAQLRLFPRSDTVLATWAIDETNAQGGEVIASIDGDTSQTLRAVTHWDLQASIPSTTYRKTWLKGTLNLDADVTRST